MAIDGNYDGKITIKRGQGISQAIRDELGLTQAESNKLGLSVWTQILEYSVTQNKQEKIYDGGSDLKGPANENFIVQTGDIIEFSKDNWNKIVDLVNDKLGKDIEKLEEAPPASNPNPPVAVDPNPSAVVDANPPVAVDANPSAAVDANPPVAVDPNPPVAVDPNPPVVPDPVLTSLSTRTIPRYANQTVRVGENFVEYDKNGRAIDICDKKGNPTRYISYELDGSVGSYTDYEYDSDGNNTREIFRDSDGSVGIYIDYEYDSDGNNTREVRYDFDGSVYLYIDFEYNSAGKRTRDIWREPDGKIGLYYVREYDENGKMIKKIDYNSDGSVVSYRTY